MNTMNDDMLKDDARFDRLVDDELSEEERRNLLTGLDNEPGGWRRCALAFLESQCWKQTFVAERSGHAPRAVRLHEEFVQPRRAQWPGRIGTLVAVAASFLLAFWVGSHIQQAGRDQVIPASGTSGELVATTGTRQAPNELSRKERNWANVVSPNHSAENPWRMVTVSSPAGSAVSSPLRVPAVERDNIDSQWLQNLPPAIPDDVMQAFDRTGHQVEQHRELIPVPLQDGRQLVVPVDNVDVHYVGRETY